MNKFVAVSLGALMLSTAALAQSPSQEVMTSIPAQSVTVTHWLHQNVYPLRQQQSR